MTAQPILAFNVKPYASTTTLTSQDCPTKPRIACFDLTHSHYTELTWQPNQS